MKDDYVQKPMFRILHFPVGPQTAFYTSSPEMYIFGILDVVLSLSSVDVPFRPYGSIHYLLLYLHIVLLYFVSSPPQSLLDVPFLFLRCIQFQSFSLARLWLSAQLGLSPPMSNSQVSISLDSILAVVLMYITPTFSSSKSDTPFFANAYSQGTCTVASADPPLKQYGGNDGPGQMTHFTKDDGLNIFRLPVGWQYLVNDVKGGTLDETNFGKYDELVQACLKTGAHCIIDIHNYARWNGQVIGASGGPTTSDFSGLWGQLATKYKDQATVVMGLMNEPHDRMLLVHSVTLPYRTMTIADDLHQLRKDQV